MNEIEPTRKEFLEEIRKLLDELNKIEEQLKPLQERQQFLYQKIQRDRNQLWKMGYGIEQDEDGKYTLVH